MRKDAAYGMIPVLLSEAQGQGPRCYLLVLHNKGHWGFPKGHPDPGESELETACRELQEETGLDQYTVLDGVRLVEHYQFVDGKGEQVDKQVIYFVAQILPSQLPEITLQAAEIADYRWCTFEEGLEVITYPASRQVLVECETLLRQQ